MTVSSSTNSAIFPGNGVTTVFPLPFRFFANSEIYAWLKNDTTDVLSPLTLGIHYTLVGAAEPELDGNPASELTMLTAPASGFSLFVKRIIPATQPTDIVNQGSFFPETHENVFDRLTMLIQQLLAIIGTGSDDSRALILGDADVDGEGFYRAKENGIVNLASANNILTSAANLQDVVDYVAGVLNIINGSPNSAANISFTTFLNLVRTAQSKMADLRTIKDGLAAGDGSDDLLEINQAIAAEEVGELYVPDGNFTVSAGPTNPNGVRLWGPGKIRSAEATGWRQWNTNFDHLPTIGREYLYRAWAFIQTQDGDRVTAPAGGAASNLNVFLYGDSTAVGFVATTGPTPVPNLPSYLWPNFALKAQLNNNGVRYATVTQRAVSGTSWRDLNAVPDLGGGTSLLYIKYGLNDAVFTDQDGGIIDPTAPVSERIAAMAVEMDEKLTEIRAAPNGAVQNVAIVLVGPTSACDTENGRNEEWLEQVRNVYVYMARKHLCCYVDPYPFLRDSRNGAQLWMDQPSGTEVDGRKRTVHMRESAMNPLWAWIVDQTFPKEALLEWGSTSFRNIGSNGAGEEANPATGPVGFRAGVTWQKATVAGGFPKDGWLKTERFADGHAKQTLHPSNAINSDNAAITRNTAAALTTWHPRWTGVAENLTFLAGWADFATGTPVPSASIDEQGYVQVQGSIKNGTITAGTSIMALPAGMRPASIIYFPVSTNAGVGTVSVDSAGAIKAVTGIDATRTSLDSIRFKASPF